MRPKFSQAGGVKSSWEEVEEMNVMKLTEDRFDWKIETLDTFGKLYEFNKLFESRITHKKPLQLKRTADEVATQTGAFKDPYLLNLVFNQEEDTTKKVFYMDSNAFSTLCTVHKSNFPFNINFNKMGNKIAVDVDYETEKAAQAFAYLETYNETINDHLPDNEKIMTKLCEENTLTKQNFIAQSLKNTEKDASIEKTLEKNEDFEEFCEENEMEFDVRDDKLYKYQKITFDKFIIYVRSNVDGYETIKNEKKEILLRNFMAVNPSDWTKKWSTAKSIIMTDCYKNNNAKVMKWLTEAYLSEVETMKIAYITRFTTQTPKKHKIIGVENADVASLSKYFGYSMNYGLSCLKAVLEGMLRINDDGTYVFHKLSYKPYVKLFKIPEAQEDEDSEEESSEEEEEDAE